MNTDKELLTAMIHGSVISYEKIFMRYYMKLLCFAEKLLKDPCMAEDVVQNVFMKIWTNRFSLNQNESIKSYLFVLTKNEIFNIFKSKAHTSLEYGKTIKENTFTITNINPETTAEMKEIGTQVHTIINGMPEQRKRIFMMSRYGHLSNEEIAEKLMISKKTVENHLNLALKDIRKNLN